MSFQYESLDHDEQEKEAGLSLSSDLRDSFSLPPPSHHRSPPRSSRPGALWSVFMFVAGIFTCAIFIVSSHHLNRRYSYETGWREEKVLPPNLIQLEQRKFLSPVDFVVDNGTEFLVTEPGERAYVGATNPEIDRAWEELLWGRYFSISEAEAKRLWGANYQIYYDRENMGYTGGFDMFHQLHCLDQIRQALHRDYYPEIPIHGPVHLDHCINHLRQSIQCWGSTAITPIKWFEGYHHGYVQSNVEHTCRKFEPIREYVSQRANGSLEVGRTRGTWKPDGTAPDKGGHHLHN